MRRRRFTMWMAAACALAACGVLGGCGGSTKTVTVRAASSTGTGAPASTGTSTAGSSAGGTATTGTGTTAAPAPTSVTPLATARSSWDGEPVRLDVLSLTRSGDVAQASVRLTNTGKSTKDVRDNVQVADLFSGAQGSNSTKLYDTLSGLLLIDAAQNREYPVARNASGDCVCDGDLSDTFIDPGQSSVLSAVFGAPPASVRSVDLFVPHFGTFHDLPISGS